MERLCEIQNPDIHNVNITTKEFQNISLFRDSRVSQMD